MVARHRMISDHKSTRGVRSLMCARVAPTDADARKVFLAREVYFSAAGPLRSLSDFASSIPIAEQVWSGLPVSRETSDLGRVDGCGFDAGPHVR